MHDGRPRRFNMSVDRADDHHVGLTGYREGFLDQRLIGRLAFLGITGGIGDPLRADKANQFIVEVIQPGGVDQRTPRALIARRPRKTSDQGDPGVCRQR